MKTIHRFAEPLLMLVLTVTLLAGCHVTSPKDSEFQKAWDESKKEMQEEFKDAMEEARTDWEEAWSGWDYSNTDSAKKHRWEVQDAAGAALYTIDDGEALKTLDGLLSDNDGKTWKRSAEDPGETAYSYVYCQEKTRLAGQDPEAERDYEALMRFAVSAEKDLVTMTILEDLKDAALSGLDLSEFLTFTVSVPAETAEALRNPAQFAE